MRALQRMREAAELRTRRLVKTGSWGPWLTELLAPEAPMIPVGILAEGGYASQIGQDLLLDQVFFARMRGGTYIDVGAHDGVTFSNSWFLESARGWTGLCIEPNPRTFKQLAVNRRATCIRAAVTSSGSAEAAFIVPSDDSLSMLSGLRSHYGRKHLRRLRVETEAQGGRIGIVTVPTVTMTALAEQHDLWEPDLLCIDVEGAEFDVLLSADWTRFRPSVVVIESNYGLAKAIRLLKTQGYVLLLRQGWDLFFVHRRFLAQRG